MIDFEKEWSGNPENVILNGRNVLSCTCGHMIDITEMIERIKTQTKKETQEEDNKRFLGMIGEDETTECGELPSQFWQNKLRQELRDKVK